DAASEQEIGHSLVCAIARHRHDFYVRASNDGSQIDGFAEISVIHAAEHDADQSGIQLIAKGTSLTCSGRLLLAAFMRSRSAVLALARSSSSLRNLTASRSFLSRRSRPRSCLRGSGSTIRALTLNSSLSEGFIAYWTRCKVA